MKIYKDIDKLKKTLQETKMSYRRFNEWERHLTEKPDATTCLLAVFQLYDMIPDQAKNRSVNVKGIIKMHRDLECLAYWNRHHPDGFPKD